MLTLARLRELLAYDPETGVFTWRVNRGAKRAGDVAGNKNCVLGYVLIGIDYRTYLAHRLAWLYMTGEWPADEVDHWDLDGANNRWVNLREATKGENGANRPAPANNTSGYKGVYWHARAGRWMAQIMKNQRSLYLGLHDTREEAAAAYLAAASKEFGEFARR